MPTAVFPSAILAEFYRFALLLTGRPVAAEQVMAETLVEIETQLEGLRGETNRQSSLAMRIRQRCLKNNAENAAPVVPRLLREPGVEVEVLAIEAYILAEHIHALPEPERSALALFYLDLFKAEEIAQLLKLSLEDLGQTLDSARAGLRTSLRGASPS